MGSGGIIPASKSQTVTFFNTTGLIEKEKGMYYVPRFSKTSATVGQKVVNAYYSAFQVVCPPFSNYSNMEISGWSPEDRTLVVKGNIDDFRLVNDQGNCLNYCVVVRNTIYSNQSHMLYYAFFITGVEQVGANSVRVTVEPDDFTNVFYLHNAHVLTQLDISGDYEPFNEKMKNCYVNRQHYNRVKVENPSRYVMSCILYTTTFFDIADGIDTILLEFYDGNATPTVVEGTILQHRWDSEEHPSLVELSIGYFEEEIDIDPEEALSTGVYNGEIGFTFTYDNTEISWLPEVPQHLDIDNREIFLNQPQTFKFKYQYRNLKQVISPLSLDSVFSKSEIKTINETATFANLPQSIQNKIVSASISFLAVEFKSAEVFAPISIKWNSNYSAEIYTRSGAVSNEVSYNYFYKTNPVVYFPFMNTSPLFRKYSPNIFSAIRTKYAINTPSYSKNHLNGLSSLSKLYDNLFKYYANYILSAYIIPYLPVEKFLLNVGSQTFDYTLEGAYHSLNTTPNSKKNTDFGSGVNVVALLSPEQIGYDYDAHSAQDIWSDNVAKIKIEISDNPTSMNVMTDPTAIYGMVISGLGFSEEHKLLIEEDTKSQLQMKTTSYDPVLESEPYSFYSISYLSSNEMIFSKARYFKGLTSEISLRMFIDVNNGVKFSVVPYYTTSNYKTPYFNEGMTITLSASIPIVSDSYISYYYQNMAQMKNQFAVNDFNRSTDLMQRFFNSGPAEAGRGFVKGGGMGAIASTISEVSGMIDNAVDWWQSDRVIEMNQKAVLADVGRKPDNLKQTGSNAYYDFMTGESHMFLNHYTIDAISYDSIAKFLERFGYQVDLYSTLNVMNRVGFNYIKLVNFDWSATNIMVSQQNSIKEIFQNGVTLVHDKTYLTSGHNYETILE